MSLLYGMFWALWRRLFGEGKFKKILSRATQEMIGIMVLGFVLMHIQMSITINNEFWKAFSIAATSLYIIVQYWSRSIGEIIDAGLSGVQNRDSYSLWFRPLCNQIVRLINWIVEDLLHLPYHIHKYYGVYDWIYSSMRALVGLLPAMILYHSWLWLILILCMYPIYLGCHKLFAKFPSLYTNSIFVKLTINEPKNLAEILHGFTFGLCIGLM